MAGRASLDCSPVRFVGVASIPDPEDAGGAVWKSSPEEALCHRVTGQPRQYPQSGQTPNSSFHLVQSIATNSRYGR